MDLSACLLYDTRSEIRIDRSKYIGSNAVLILFYGNIHNLLLQLRTKYYVMSMSPRLFIVMPMGLLLCQQPLSPYFILLAVMIVLSKFWTVKYLRDSKEAIHVTSFCCLLPLYPVHMQQHKASGMDVTDVVVFSCPVQLLLLVLCLFFSPTITKLQFQVRISICVCMCASPFFPYKSSTLPGWLWHRNIPIIVFITLSWYRLHIFQYFEISFDLLKEKRLAKSRGGKSRYIINITSFDFYTLTNLQTLPKIIRRRIFKLEVLLTKRQSNVRRRIIQVDPLGRLKFTKSEYIIYCLRRSHRIEPKSIFKNF